MRTVQWELKFRTCESVNLTHNKTIFFFKWHTRLHYNTLSLEERKKKKKAHLNFTNRSKFNQISMRRWGIQISIQILNILSISICKITHKQAFITSRTNKHLNHFAQAFVASRKIKHSYHYAQTVNLLWGLTNICIITHKQLN